MTTFQVTEAGCPAGVVDLMLWRDAQHILRRHCDVTDDNMCVWCGREWPCGPRRLAERATAASYAPARAHWSVYDEVFRRPRFNERASDGRPSYTSAAAAGGPGLIFDTSGPAGRAVGSAGRHYRNRRSYDAV